MARPPGRSPFVRLATGLITGLIAVAPALGAPPPAGADGDAVVIVGAQRRSALTLGALSALAPVTVRIAKQTSHGPAGESYDGPLLWTLLVRAGLVDPVRPRSEVMQTILVTGRDGYSAAVALGEISPQFEGKAVILADRKDGEPLAANHLELVVPGDKRRARDVHDVVRIEVEGAPPAGP